MVVHFAQYLDGTYDLYVKIKLGVLSKKILNEKEAANKILNEKEAATACAVADSLTLRLALLAGLRAQKIMRPKVFWRRLLFF